MQPHTGYNYDRFHPAILREDVQRLRRTAGPMPGDRAPDFDLTALTGERRKLSELQGKPVVLIIGSGTCPLTSGSLPGLKRLYQEFRDEAVWLMLYVREAHPGERSGGHHTIEQKREQAARLRDEAHVPWPILIDRLDGEVHEAYGGLPNPAFLIDREGRVAFRGEMAHAPSLRDALLELRARDWRGPVAEPLDRGMHMLGATAYGWSGLRRGGRMAKRDAWRYAPPLAANLSTGRMLAPALGPVASRSSHLPPSAKIGLGVAFAALAMIGLRAVRR